MQVSPNDIYRPPSLNETPPQQPIGGARFDVAESARLARENRVNEVRSELEKMNFGKAALIDEHSVNRSASLAAENAHLEQQTVDISEIIPYVKHLGEFISFEREDAINNGWSV